MLRKELVRDKKKLYNATVGQSLQRGTQERHYLAKDRSRVS